METLSASNEAAFALERLTPEDRKHIDTKQLRSIVQTFFEKRRHVADVGEAIRYTLFERHLNNKSQDVYSAYARLLRKVERRRNTRRAA